MLEGLEDVQRRWSYRVVGCLGGLALGAAILVAPTPEGMSVEAHRVAAVAAVMALWWLAAVFPLTVTALVPLVAFPLLGVSDLATVARPYAHPLIFLCLGGFVIGFALEEAGIHGRLTAELLQIRSLRASPRRVLGALMAAAGLLSAVVSNTATAVMMMPLALGLAKTTGVDARGRSGFALGLAYACSIGGVATLVGTFPNAVFVQQVAADLDLAVSFGQWLGVGLPFSLVGLPLAWWVVGRMLVSDRDLHMAAPARPPWKVGGRSVLAITVVAMAAWITRKPVQIGELWVPGWSPALGLDGWVDDAWVAIGAALALFLVRGEGGLPLLDFREAERRIPWSVLFLLGGGYALADAIRSSGLTAWLATFTQHLAALPLWATALLIALLVTFLTELTSNTATTQVLLPLLSAGAVAAGVDPLAWMVPATLAASCAFMLPVATPPNAIAAESGAIRPEDMARAGAVLNLALAVWVAFIGTVLAPRVLG